MMKSFGGSKQGPSHPTNQDAFHADPVIGLYVVADGMGGKSAGEVASQLTIETVYTYMSQSHGTEEISWPFGLDAKLSLPGNRLRTAVRMANRRVWREAGTNLKYVGMGCTVVAALAADSQVTMSSAGDSRIYRISAGNIARLTEDDSWVRAALEEGLVEPDELEGHPLRNMITNAIGMEKAIKPHITEAPFEAGDWLLLCSDGLYKAVSDEEILEEVLRGGEDLEKTTESLIDKAVNNDANDDVTVLIVHSVAS